MVTVPVWLNSKCRKVKHSVHKRLFTFRNNRGTPSQHDARAARSTPAATTLAVGFSVAFDLDDSRACPLAGTDDRRARRGRGSRTWLCESCPDAFAERRSSASRASPVPSRAPRWRCGGCRRRWFYRRNWNRTAREGRRGRRARSRRRWRRSEANRLRCRRRRRGKGEDASWRSMGRLTRRR